MTPVVQATCPNCRKTLLIPAEWLQQPMKCKHCSKIFMARPAAPVAKLAPPPAPLARPVAPVAKPSPMAMPAPVSVSSRTPVPATKPRGAAPVAAPYSPPGVAASNPFAHIDTPAPAGASYPRRRSRGSRWTGLLLLLCVLGIAGGVGWSFRDQIRGLIDQAENKKPDGDDSDQRAGVTPERETKRPEPTRSESPVKPTPPEGEKKPGPVETTPMKTPRPETTPTKRPDPIPKPPVETKPVKPPEPMKKPSEVPVAKGPFPRRALLINVSNYVYANPIGYGTGQNFEDLRTRLINRLQFPNTQITEVSDGMRRPPGVPAIPPPVRPVIEQAVNDFLAGSRAQDRVVIYFAGHAIEIENEAFLAPLEGDLEKKETLIPLNWLYKQLEGCKARQKLLILDVCRLNPAQGMERPGGGPMSKKLDELLQRPPGGMQVWAACVEGQSSYENPEFNTSYFLEKLLYALSNNLKGIQTADDSLPLNDLVEGVNKQLKVALAPQKKEQTSRLSGVEAAGGVAYNPSEPLPTALVIKPAPAGAEGAAPVDREVVKKILDEIEVPPVKKSRGMGAAFSATSLLPFPAKSLEAYPPANGESALRKAVDNARKALHDVAGSKDNLPEEFMASANEKQFKDGIEQTQRNVAKIEFQLREALEDMEMAEKKRAEEPSKRWQANFDYLHARLKMQMAYVIEYTSLLGQMRKEAPARDVNLHNGWRMASQEKLQGDKQGKDLAKSAKKLLEKVISDYPGTPWEMLAKRDRLTTLGLEWQATQIGGRR